MNRGGSPQSPEPSTRVAGARSREVADGEHVEVVVVGGGQAGLAIGYFLARQGRRFLILEAGDSVGAAWRQRWDSLALFTPRRYDALPGVGFPGGPDGYPTRDEVVSYLTAYAETCKLPLVLNSAVRSLTQTDDGFQLECSDRTVAADQVVMATGPFQLPFTPALAGQFGPEVFQMHSTGTGNRRTSRQGPCWLSVGATLVSRSRRSSRARTRSTCRLAHGKRCCPRRFGAVTCSGGSPRQGCST